MLPYERQQAIFDYIRDRHAASVSELSKRFFISETSIRRDLSRLEHSGLIRKTYGGAVLMQGDNEVISLEARSQVAHEEKGIVAQKASALIRNGQVIFLDSSSTAMMMVPFLSGLSNLSVITNGLKTAAALAAYPQFKVYVLGGLLNTQTFSMCGTLTCQMVQNLHANILFVSPKGVDERGSIYCADEEEAYLRHLMMRNADQTVLLCNHGKLGQRGAFHLCSLSEVNIFVCNETLDPSWESLLKEYRVSPL